MHPKTSIKNFIYGHKNCTIEFLDTLLIRLFHLGRIKEIVPPDLMEINRSFI